ncbi:MAG: homocysteine S-methyltransferase family protein [Legionellales bacterium]|jgi:S-methylmethionine-dependent homocysteine/selenocysteine methylase
MKIHDFLAKEHVIVTDAPMETRIMYQAKIPMDKDASIFRLVYTQNEREVLAGLYRQDLNITSKYNQAIILNAPTFRASSARIAKIGFDAKNTATINRDCVQMVRDIRDEYPMFLNKIMINGPIGPKNDAYSAQDAITAEEARHYHAPQIEGLIAGGADIVSGVTFPSAQEALGVAQCCSDFNVPYSIGFVLTKCGTLLDGTKVTDLISTIDNHVKTPPVYYMIICSHASIVKPGLTPYHENYKRIYGIKANGSAKSPEELAKLDKPETDPPVEFAKQMLALRDQFGFKILGGCCGTDHRHVEALCQMLAHD